MLSGKPLSYMKNRNCIECIVMYVYIYSNHQSLLDFWSPPKKLVPQCRPTIFQPPSDENFPKIISPLVARG